MTGPDDCGHLSDAPRAQSEVIGIVLLTGVVVLITAVVGAGVLANVASQAQNAPLVDAEANATTQFVTVEHVGGDALDTDDVAVVLVGDNRDRRSLSSFTQVAGSDSSRFEPGDAWRRTNGVGGDPIEVLVVDEASNVVLDREMVRVTVTIAARFVWSPANPVQGEPVSFDAGDSTVDGSTIDTYAWDFDDDGTTDATGQSPSTSFPATGEYPVTLTVTAVDGRTAATTKTLTVYNEVPSASFTYSPSNPSPGDSVSFDGSGSSDPDGSVSSYAWDFDDDGTTDASGETATYTFGSTGDYPVTLTVTDDDGATNVESTVVSVGSQSPPSVSITGTSVTAEGQSGKYDVDVTFEATDPDGDVTNYTVVLYDSSATSTELDRTTGSPYGGSSTTVTVSDSDTNDGETPLYVVVRVGDSKSQVGTAEKEADANNGAPTATFTYSPNSPAVDQSITFDAAGSTDPEGDSLRYEWDWTDDGTVDTTTSDPDVDATHSYPSGGTYTVSLTVRDGNGGVDTTTQTVSVGSKDFTSVSASDMSKNSNSETQTFRFTLDEALADGETVTINLDDPQSVKNNGDADPVDYRSGTVDTAASSLDGGSATISAAAETASITYTADGEVSAGTQVSIEVDDVETGTLGGNNRDPQVTFARSDGLQDSTTFSLTSGGGR